MSYLGGVDPKAKMEKETDKCTMQMKNLTYMPVSRTNTCQNGPTINFQRRNLPSSVNINRNTRHEVNTSHI